MDTENTNAGQQAPNFLLPEVVRRDFWRHYEPWLYKASDEELAQLQTALESFATAEVQSFVERISAALKDEAQRRQYPESLMSRLQEANWPGAAANG